MIDKLIDYLLVDSRGVSTGGGKPNFNHVEDYRYIVPSFIKLYGINLERETVSWYEYKTMLEGCFMSDCILKKVVEIRTAKMPKDPKAAADLLDLKAKYRLHCDDGSIGGLFDTLKGMAKNG